MSSTIVTTFYKSYVGKCKASIIGYNNFYQTSILFYNFTILVWPQQNCLYWEGSEKIDWTKCKFGYILNYNTNEWESADTFIDKWIIIGFTICTIFATIFTQYDTDICFLVLEHISMYFILFISSNSSNLVASSYFKEVLAVISNMSSLLFPLYRQQFNIFNTTCISRYFILNWSTMVLLTVSLTIIRRCLNNSFNRNSNKSYYISKLIAKYLMWNSWFMLFWALYEIEDATISLAKILSLTFTIIWTLAFLSFTYWVILNYESECWICFRFKWMKQAKLELTMVSYLNSTNYRYYIKYNFMRKILYPVIMSLTINYSISPYIFTIWIIPLQIMYFWLSFGVWIFDSYMKRMQIVINESLMVFTILTTTIIFMNSRNQDINYFSNFSNIVLNMIRIQILGTIVIESIRMIWW